MIIINKDDNKLEGKKVNGESYEYGGGKKIYFYEKHPLTGKIIDTTNWFKEKGGETYYSLKNGVKILRQDFINSELTYKTEILCGSDERGVYYEISHNYQKEYSNNKLIEEKVGYGKYTHTGEFILNGLSKSWYENGQLKSEGEYKENKKEGLFKTYYENGEVESEIFWENDIKKGTHVGYYDNGNLKFNGNSFFNNEKEIWMTSWNYNYPNGDKKKEIITRTLPWIMIEQEIGEEWYENGILKKRTSLLDDNEFWIVTEEWYKNGDRKKVLSKKVDELNSGNDDIYNIIKWGEDRKEIKEDISHCWVNRVVEMYEVDEDEDYESDELECVTYYKVNRSPNEGYDSWSDDSTMNELNIIIQFFIDEKYKYIEEYLSCEPTNNFISEEGVKVEKLKEMFEEDVKVYGEKLHSEVNIDTMILELKNNSTEILLRQKLNL
tara:strand:+ start:134 stop:1444 length:1311 start_codon:yes stop_codon:yes gene_type:complete